MLGIRSAEGLLITPRKALRGMIRPFTALTALALARWRGGSGASLSVPVAGRGLAVRACKFADGAGACTHRRSSRGRAPTTPPGCLASRRWTWCAPRRSWPRLRAWTRRM